MKAVASEIPEATEWLNEGINCYNQLIESGYAGHDDYNNLIYLYEKSGRMKDCLDMLLKMELMYPESYEIPMQRSYIYYRLENDRPLAERDYAKVLDDYEKAVDLFQSSGKDISSDAGMAQLDSIIEQLRGKGWLE